MSRYIVCGLGQVGYRVAKLLAQLGKHVTVITTDVRPDFADELTPLGVKIVQGDARSDTVLLGSGLREADAIIACTDDDLTNLEVTLDARHHHPGIRIVARIFDQGLARDLEESGLVNRALSMSVLAAPSFATAAFRDGSLGEFWADGHAYRVRLEDSNYRVTEAPRAGAHKKPKRHPIRSLARVWTGAPLALRRIMLLIVLLATASVAVFHFGMNISVLDSVYFVVTTLTTTGYGDITPTKNGPWIQVFGTLMMLLGSAGVATLYSLITDFIVSERFNEIMGRKTVDESGHLVIAGLGNVGLRVASHLAAQDWAVVVLDNDADTANRGSLPPSCQFLSGDARDSANLLRAGADRASAVLALTDDDSTNLSVSIAAKRLNPDARVVTRLFDDRFATKVQAAMSIDAALSASRIAAPLFVGAALGEPGVYHFVQGCSFVSVAREDVAFRVSERPLQG